MGAERYDATHSAVLTRNTRLSGTHLMVYRETTRNRSFPYRVLCEDEPWTLK